MPLRVADPTLWFNLPGVIVAYQAIGAPSPIHAPKNVANGQGGRYTARAYGTTSPNWSGALGWGTNWARECFFHTNLTPATDQTWSFLVRVSGFTAGYGVAVGGYVNSPCSLGFGVGAGAYNAGWFANGGTHEYAGPGLAEAVFGVAGSQAYSNGVAVGSTLSGWWGGASPVTIGGLYEASNAISNIWTGYVAALLISVRVLSAAEMWLASRQMAYCHVNPAWSAWSPPRRWFIPPPPPPVAATPVLSTIYINSADIGDTSLFDDVSGAVVSATYARTGTNSFKLTSGDYLQADLTSSATKYTKFGLLVTDTPASDALLVAWQETGTEHVSLYLSDKLTLQMQQGSTIIQTSPTTLEINTWYCVETKIVVHDTIGRFQVRIDGVDDMSAIGINTDDNVSGTINEIRFESPVDDTYIDDIVVREDQWCGTGGVYVVVPTAAGTVEEWTGAYSDVNDLPPSFTDYIEGTSGAGSDQLFRHGGLAGDYDINIVGVFAKGRLAAAADEVFYALARSTTTDDTGDAQDLDTTGVYARVLLTADPHGNIAWTTHAVNNALQIGAKS